jgi:hypothetical protein
MAALIAAPAAAPCRSAAEGASHPQQTLFEIAVNGRTIGREMMTVEEGGDSIAIRSRTAQQFGVDSLRKALDMTVDSYDLNLRNYSSIQNFRGHSLRRGLSLHDTVFTSYRDQDGRGTGDTFVRPPGHLFVLDPGLFASFDLMCRMLRGRAFERRTVNLVVLSSTADTVIATPLVDGGLVTLKQKTRSVSARRMTLGDEPGAYHLWMATDGRLLRLEQVPSGLRVERVSAPPRRARAAG